MKLMLNSSVFSMVFAGMVAVNTPTYAATDNHQHSHNNDMDQSMSSQKGMFLEKKEIDGYSVSFHVMKADQNMQHGGSHNFMVKVERQGKVVDNVDINSKVIYPDKNTTSKMLAKMGDWYMTGYDLNTTGKYQLMVLFKTQDGKKHGGGVYYEN